MPNGEFGIVGVADVVYTSGADLTIPDSQYVSSNQITPTGAPRLAVTVRLATSAIMYFRAGAVNGAIFHSEAVPANEWWSFEIPWNPSRAFSVRFSVSQTVLDVVINGK